MEGPGRGSSSIQIARRQVPATLVLVGNIATDDPEGERVHQSLLDSREDRIIILSVEDTALVNALQRHAAVVLQKSIREGFGLTVSEALWKGTPVIGGNVGGIRYQIQNGVNGYLVSSVKEAAERMVELLKNKKMQERMGKKGKEIVRERFLLTRLLEQYLDLFNSFVTLYTLKNKSQIQLPLKTAYKLKTS
jgi:trehalose synthase